MHILLCIWVHFEQGHELPSLVQTIVLFFKTESGLFLSASVNS